HLSAGGVNAEWGLRLRLGVTLGVRLGLGCPATAASLIREDKGRRAGPLNASGSMTDSARQANASPVVPMALVALGPSARGRQGRKGWRSVVQVASAPPTAICRSARSQAVAAVVKSTIP